MKISDISKSVNPILKDMDGQIIIYLTSEKALKSKYAIHFWRELYFNFNI